MNQKLEKIQKDGYLQKNVNLPSIWQDLVLKEDYQKLDKAAFTALAPGGVLRNEIDDILKAKSIEHILALRSVPDEEGIWHDDGTRSLAFSLSLNLTINELRGGSLLMRRKSVKEQIFEITTPKWGVLTIFATGEHGWEHRTMAVIKGKRFVLAGWCYL